MFIEIDKSILSSPDILSRHRYQIMELFTTHYRGEHFLFFQRTKEYVDNLKNLFAGDDFYVKILSKIVDDLTFNGELYKVMETKCMIVEHVMDYHNNLNIIYISISKLKVPIVETKLLGENITDANFYQELTKLFISQKNNLYRGEIKCETVGGGGATTSNTLSAIASSCKYFCLCITDSDFDGEKVTSDTPRKVEEFCSQNDGSFSHYKLPCRELENLIPPEYYRRILIGDEIAKIDRLIQLGFETQRFYDYKQNFGDRIFERYYDGDFKIHRQSFYKELPFIYKENHEKLIKKIIEWCCAPNAQRYII